MFCLYTEVIRYALFDCHAYKEHHKSLQAVAGSLMDMFLGGWIYFGIGSEHGRWGSFPFPLLMVNHPGWLTSIHTSLPQKKMAIGLQESDFSVQATYVCDQGKELACLKYLNNYEELASLAVFEETRSWVNRDCTVPWQNALLEFCQTYFAFLYR